MFVNIVCESIEGRHHPVGHSFEEVHKLVRKSAVLHHSKTQQADHGNDECSDQRKCELNGFEVGNGFNWVH